VYVLASMLAGVGGLTFIVTKGTIGGAVMNVGFGLYGVLTVLAAVCRPSATRAPSGWRRTARGRCAVRADHRLVAVPMDYGFWILLTDGAGHADNFTGPFDRVMAFWFYLPNLVVAEAFIRRRRMSTRPAVRLAAAGVLAAATGFLLLGAYYFTKIVLGPRHPGWLPGERRPVPALP
jgi:hypothetical protein